MRTKNVLLGLSLLLASVFPSLAGSEGGYLGFQVGAISGTATTTEYGGPWDFGEYSMTGLDAVFGLQGGFSWRVGDGFVGVEADLSFSSFDESRTFGAGTYRHAASWDSVYTVRARGGLALDRAMVYLTAGLAFVDVDQSFGDLNDPALFVSRSGSETGFAAGAGVEFTINERWTLKGEFLHVGLPSDNVADFVGNTGDFVSSADMVRFGMNYSF